MMTKNVLKFGYLYDWETSKNVCPTGWHLPSNDEWTILIDNLGGNEIAGIKMKEEGTTNWNAYNASKDTLPFVISKTKIEKSNYKYTEASNESGFTALPSGYRDYNKGKFKSINENTIFWSNTKLNNELVNGQLLNSNYNGVNRGAYKPNSGFCVRCIKN